MLCPKRFSGRALRVEGQVVAVCQEMGCWMEIRDQTRRRRLMFGCTGIRSSYRATSVDTERHSKQRSSRLTRRRSATTRQRPATGRVAQLELDASGVDITD